MLCMISDGYNEILDLVKKNKIQNDSTSKLVSNIATVYFAVTLFAFALMMYILLTIVDFSDDIEKTTISSIITVIFGGFSKSLYSILILAPYNFEEDKFNLNTNNKKYKITLPLVVDLLSGISIIAYLLMQTNFSNSWIHIGLIVCAVLLVILWFISMGNYKSTDN